MARKYGSLNKRTRLATKHPTSLDIAWAAGIYEGEGSSYGSPRYTPRVTLPQKDPWILHRPQELFGGTVGSHHYAGTYRWTLGGQLARGFLYTIFTYLSPRRREQVKRALLQEMK